MPYERANTLLIPPELNKNQAYHVHYIYQIISVVSLTMEEIYPKQEKDRLYRQRSYALPTKKLQLHGRDRYKTQSLR